MSAFRQPRNARFWRSSLTPHGTAKTSARAFSNQIDERAQLRGNVSPPGEIERQARKRRRPLAKHLDEPAIGGAYLGQEILGGGAIGWAVTGAVVAICCAPLFKTLMAARSVR